MAERACTSDEKSEANHSFREGEGELADIADGREECNNDGEDDDDSDSSSDDCGSIEDSDSSGAGFDPDLNMNYMNTPTRGTEGWGTELLLPDEDFQMWVGGPSTDDTPLVLRRIPDVQLSPQEQEKDDANNSGRQIKLNTSMGSDILLDQLIRAHENMTVQDAAEGAAATSTGQRDTSGGAAVGPAGGTAAASLRRRDTSGGAAGGAASLSATPPSAPRHTRGSPRQGNLVASTGMGSNELLIRLIESNARPNNEDNVRAGATGLPARRSTRHSGGCSADPSNESKYLRELLREQPLAHTRPDNVNDAQAGATALPARRRARHSGGCSVNLSNESENLRELLQTQPPSRRQERRYSEGSSPDPTRQRHTGAARLNTGEDIDEHLDAFIKVQYTATELDSDSD